jgi:hypothetical protein
VELVAFVLLQFRAFAPVLTMEPIRSGRRETFFEVADDTTMPSRMEGTSFQTWILIEKCLKYL